MILLPVGLTGCDFGLVACEPPWPRDQETVEAELEAYATAGLIVHGVAVVEATCTHDAPPAPGGHVCDEGASLVRMQFDWAPADERLAPGDPVLGVFREGAADAHDKLGYHRLGLYDGVLYDTDDQYRVSCGSTDIDRGSGLYGGNFLLEEDVVRNHLDHAGLRAAVQRGVDLGEPISGHPFTPGCPDEED